jgi:hypothetical protein
LPAGPEVAGRKRKYSGYGAQAEKRRKVNLEQHTDIAMAAMNFGNTVRCAKILKSIQE